MSNFRVKILIATHNGIPWLTKQLDSILAQVDVDVALHVSDDASASQTLEYLKQLAAKDARVILLDSKRIGSSGQNFYRLIEEVSLEDGCDYVAFSDQDDVWEADKLISHIQLAKQHGADGVSSNVMAFWPDGREELIDKAQPQSEFDYLFESAGPGCTFLMTPWLVSVVREQLLDEHSPAKDVALHDWLTYAVCRAHGRKWVIDSKPSVRYRQHQSNVVGANVGLKAKWVRLQKLKQGWYRKEVIKIAQVCNRISPNNETSKLLELLNSKHYFSQLKLLSYVGEARRSLVDRGLLAISIVLRLF